MALQGFAGTFRTLTGYAPYPWQVALAKRFASGDLPEQIDVPTGAGKTSIMALWLAALAQEAGGGRRSRSLPRRLVWVVDRRAVVDQASAEAEKIASRLTVEPSQDRDPTALAVREALLSLSADRTPSEPLAVSTLRGGKADNGDWKLDPTRPAIVVGTVDMVGSRLLFSGYGSGRWQRPYDAALLGQDSLLVLDEAHLSPAFATLTRGLVRLQGRGSDQSRSLRVMHLSATIRNRSESAFGLTKEDLSCAPLARRLRAPKSLYLHEPPPRPFEAVLASLALVHEGKARSVVVYVRSPESAGRVTDALRKSAKERVRLLTGTLRGYERDGLMQDSVFRRFLPDNGGSDEPGGTAYLVATSAAEVGVDLDSEHMVGDLTSVESMLQRFGRVNRRGFGSACIDVIREQTGSRPGEEKPAWFAPTVTYFESLPRTDRGGFDVSVSALVDHPPPPEAFSPAPPLAELRREHLDSWSMTSVGRAEWPARPSPHLWLHGEDSAEPPETDLVWREDVEWLADDSVAPEDAEEALDSYRILPQERARGATWRIRRFVRALAQRAPKARAIVLGVSNEFWRGELRHLADAVAIDLEYATILLPPAVGGLSDGFIDAAVEEPVPDVADRIPGVRRGRFHLLPLGGGWKTKRVGLNSEEVQFPEVETPEQAIGALEKATGLEVVAEAATRMEEDGGAVGRPRLVYAVGKETLPGSFAGSRVASTEMSLDEHHFRVERWCRRLGEALGLRAELVEALACAGRSHDLGKSRDSWQAAIGNPEPSRPLAKTSHGHFDHRMTGGYRHELGSLLELADRAVGSVPDKDLVLHLVAAHHGYSRPSFRPRAWDRARPQAESARASAESLRRFARLSEKYGWYGLAYLESLLKAADALGSREEA